jgi:hypothetical protein
MTKYLLASLAAFALTAGPALAQEASSTDTTSVTTAPAPAASYSTSKSVKTTDSMGDQSEHSQSYSAGPNGVDASQSSETTGPDGTVRRATHEEQSPTPMGESTTITHSSTSTSTQ